MYLGTIIGSTVNVTAFITLDYYLYIEREKDNSEVSLHKLIDCKFSDTKKDNAVVMKFLSRGMIYNSTSEVEINFGDEEHREKFLLELQHMLKYIVS